LLDGKLSVSSSAARFFAAFFSSINLIASSNICIDFSFACCINLSVFAAVWRLLELFDVSKTSGDKISDFSEECDRAWSTLEMALEHGVPKSSSGLSVLE